MHTCVDFAIYEVIRLRDIAYKYIKDNPNEIESIRIWNMLSRDKYYLVDLALVAVQRMFEVPDKENLRNILFEILCQHEYNLPSVRMLKFSDGKKQFFDNWRSDST